MSCDFVLFPFRPPSPVSVSSSQVSTLAGFLGPGYQDGDIDSAQFQAPSSICTDFDNGVLISDSRNHVIRKISSGVSIHADISLRLSSSSFSLFSIRSEDIRSFFSFLLSLYVGRREQFER